MAGFLSVRPQDWATPQATFTGDLYIAGNGVSRYDSNTATWTDLAPPPTVVVGLAASGDHVWIGGEDGTIYHSADRGATWGSDVGAPATGGFSRFCTDGTNLVVIQVDPNPYNAFASTDSVLSYRPLDGSGSWSSLHTSSASIPIRGGSVVGTRVWFAADDGSGNPIFKYLTIGGAMVDTDVTAVNASSVAIQACSGNASIAYGCQAYDSAGPGPGKVWRFVDGTGTDVTPSGLPSGALAGVTSVASNADDTVVLATHFENGIGLTIYRSTNQGASWSAVYGPNAAFVSNDQQSDIAWSLTNAARVAVLTDNDSALISGDSGATWTEATGATTNGRFAIAVL